MTTTVLPHAAPSQTASPAPSPKSLLVCVVCDAGRQDASLGCAFSLINLQSELMRRGEYSAELHFVRDLDEALNVLWKSREGVPGALIVDCSMSFAPDFPLAAAASGKAVVAASYPLPGVDWGRVARAAGAARSAKAAKAGVDEPIEPPQFWGNAYSAVPEPGSLDPATGYVRPADGAAGLGVAWVSRDAVLAAAAIHPEIVAGDYAAFAVPGVFGGERQAPERRFLSLLAGTDEVWLDVERPATTTGPVEFGGCVGARKVLRT